MKLGACLYSNIPGNLKSLTAAGFSFIECSVQEYLVPEKSEAEFLPCAEKLKAMELPDPVANALFPKHVKVTGPDYDEKRLKGYLENACDRAARLGIKTLVFGSNGAREIPEGFCREKAHGQLLDLGLMAADIAASHGIVIAVEPLHSGVCNVFTSVSESAKYVRELDRPSIRLLVDSYHFFKCDNDYEALADAVPLLAHVHVSTAGRMAPGLEPCDFSRFFKTLRCGGYNALASIEGNWNDPEKEANLVFKTLNDLANG